MVLQCSWCGMVRVENRWMKDAPQPANSHGICPFCLERVSGELHLRPEGVTGWRKPAPAAPIDSLSSPG